MRLNIYGVVLRELNSWETDSAEMLDLDTTGTVGSPRGEAMGRPLGVTVEKRGALLVADDLA